MQTAHDELKGCLNEKLDKESIYRFEQITSKLPSLSQFNDTIQKTNETLEKYRLMYIDTETDIKNHLQIIARFDEVLSLKASK